MIIISSEFFWLIITTIIIWVLLKSIYFYRGQSPNFCMRLVSWSFTSIVGFAVANLKISLPKCSFWKHFCSKDFSRSFVCCRISAGWWTPVPLALPPTHGSTRLGPMRPCWKRRWAKTVDLTGWPDLLGDCPTTKKTSCITKTTCTKFGVSF